MLEGSGGSRFYGGSICLRASGGSILWKPHVPEGAGGFDLKRPHLLEGGQVFDFKEAPFTCRALRWHKVEAFLAEAIPSRLHQCKVPKHILPPKMVPSRLH